MKLRHPAVVGTTTLLFSLAGAAIGSSAQAAGTTFVPCGNAAGLVTAVNNANSGGPTNIVLGSNCTYTLTTVNYSDVNGDSGLPIVNTHVNVSISGYHTTITRASTAPAFRIATVAGTLTLNQITLSGGHTEAGGGFLNYGALTLNSSSVTGNHSDGPGGGGNTPFGATTTLNSSSVDGNLAGSNAGGLDTTVGATTTLNHSSVDGNITSGNGGGLRDIGATIHLNFSSVTGNVANAGGGIYDQSGPVVLLGSTVTGNTPNNCAPPNTVPGCIG